MLLERFTSPEQIRRFLAVSGVKGKRQQLAHCPIANYVKRLHPDAVAVLASFRVAVWHRLGDHEPMCVYPVTDAMGHFMLDFDRGMYPELIARD